MPNRSRKLTDEEIARLTLMAQIEAAGGLNDTPVLLDEVHRLVNTEAERYLSILANPEQKLAWKRRYGLVK